MKPGAVTTLDKRNAATSTKFDKDFILANCDFQFMANLEPSRSCILDAWLIKLTFPLTITFYLTKIENNLNISNTALIVLLYIKVLLDAVFFCKKC